MEETISLMNVGRIKSKLIFSLACFPFYLFITMDLLAEHMLFYASEKYPGEQDYTKYILEVPLFILSYVCLQLLLTR